MQFSIYALDKPDSSQLRAQHRDAHRTRLDNHDHPVKVVLAGPLFDADEKPVGSLIIVDAEKEEDVRAFVQADPYIRHGVYQSADIKPVKWTIGTPPA